MWYGCPSRLITKAHLAILKQFPILQNVKEALAQLLGKLLNHHLVVKKKKKHHRLHQKCYSWDFGDYCCFWIAGLHFGLCCIHTSLFLFSSVRHKLYFLDMRPYLQQVDR